VLFLLLSALTVNAVCVIVGRILPKKTQSMWTCYDTSRDRSNVGSSFRIGSGPG